MRNIAAAQHSKCSAASSTNAGTNASGCTLEGPEAPCNVNAITIDSNAAVWFNGYTPNAETVSMIAVDNTRKPFRRDTANYLSNGLKFYTVPSTGVTLGGTGGGDAGHDLWRPTMQKYLRSLPVESFTPPPAALVGGSSPGPQNQPQ